MYWGHIWDLPSCKWSVSMTHWFLTRCKPQELAPTSDAPSHPGKENEDGFKSEPQTNQRLPAIALVGAYTLMSITSSAHHKGSEETVCCTKSNVRELEQTRMATAMQGTRKNLSSYFNIFATLPLVSLLECLPFYRGFIAFIVSNYTSATVAISQNDANALTTTWSHTWVHGDPETPISHAPFVICCRHHLPSGR